jgi:transcription antitermination factor NusG
MSKFIAGWYVVYTKPRHEKKIAIGCSERGLRNYLPTVKRIHKWHDRKKLIEEPLFPSYVFVYLDDMEHYYEGLNIKGVWHYVRSGKEIARVNEKTVEDVRVLVEKGADVEVSSATFQKGQRLTISQGPLTGLSCEMIQLNGKEKLLVRVSLLQRTLLATLPSEYFVAGHQMTL